MSADGPENFISQAHSLFKKGKEFKRLQKEFDSISRKLEMYIESPNPSALMVGKYRSQLVELVPKMSTAGDVIPLHFNDRIRELDARWAQIQTQSNT